jgi:transposase
MSSLTSCGSGSSRCFPPWPRSAAAGGGTTGEILEGIAWRFRTGSPWRDVPERFGPWQTVYDRHNLWSENGMYAALFRHLLAEADADGELDWLVSVDSTIVRAHQHAAGARREDQGGLQQHTGGLGRTTSIVPSSQMIMRLVVREVAGRPRPTWPATARAGRCQWW